MENQNLRFIGYIICVFLVAIPTYEIVTGIAPSLYHLAFLILSLWLYKSTKALKD